MAGIPLGLIFSIVNATNDIQVSPSKVSTISLLELRVLIVLLEFSNVGKENHSILDSIPISHRIKPKVGAKYPELYSSDSQNRFLICLNKHFGRNMQSFT
jgi:hypothetical protein